MRSYSKTSCLEFSLEITVPEVSVDVQSCIIFGRSCRFFFFSFPGDSNCRGCVTAVSHGFGCGLSAV